MEGERTHIYWMLDNSRPSAKVFICWRNHLPLSQKFENRDQGNLRKISRLLVYARLGLKPSASNTQALLSIRTNWGFTNSSEMFTVSSSKTAKKKMDSIIFILQKRELRSIGTLRNTASLWNCLHVNSGPSRFLSLGHFLKKSFSF